MRSHLEVRHAGPRSLRTRLRTHIHRRRKQRSLPRPLHHPCEGQQLMVLPGVAQGGRITLFALSGVFRLLVVA
jgi:hypothetical protein